MGDTSLVPMTTGPLAEFLAHLAVCPGCPETVKPEMPEAERLRVQAEWLSGVSPSGEDTKEGQG